MSRTPVPSRKANKSTSTSRSFTRKQRLERERAQRRALAKARTRRAPELRQQLQAALRRVPVAAWICALIALLNATAWSVITPPFQGRDEVDHFAYVSHLAETGKSPQSAANTAHRYSTEETAALSALHYAQVRFTSYTPSITSVAEQRLLEQQVGAKGSLGNSSFAGGTAGEPPLFYALQSIPYALGGGNVLVKLQLMRLFDALLGAITALLIFFFVREVVPGVPWAATVGAICVALQPQFAFTTGSVNPDALLFTLSAVAFLCLARGFRRRLTPGLAALLGAAIAAGLLTYFSFIGIAIGAVAALLVLAVRDYRRGQGRAALLAPGLSIGIGISPAVLYAIGNLLAGHAAFGEASGVGSAAAGGSSLFNEISYVWELYLPRLPGMTHYFQGISTWREIWFDRSVGLYGWMDTTFPTWVDNIALIPAAAIALLCGRELVIRRHALRARLPEFAGYAAVTLGLFVMIGLASYSSDALLHEDALGEPRYLLPLLPLLGVLIALVVRGAGRRWMPVAGAAVVVLFLGHDLLSQLQVVGRFYG